MNQARKILIIDDEMKIIEVIQSYLEKDGYDVYAARSGKDALVMFENIGPSLVILDLMLPDMTGEEICQQLRRKSRVPIIMLTAKVEEMDIINGLNIGADDYVTKPFSPRQLVARVSALLRRTQDEVFPELRSFNNGDLLIDLTTREVKKGGESVNLTPHEFQLLTTLMKYPKKIFTRQELIQLVMGDDYEGYDRIIDTHIKNLRQKIEMDSRNPRYILTVHGVGYRFGGE